MQRFWSVINVVLNGMHFHVLGYLHTVRSVNSTNNIDFSISKCTIIVVTILANIQTILDDYEIKTGPNRNNTRLYYTLYKQYWVTI